MTLFPAAERRLAETFSRLIALNPFLPERTEIERVVLGDAFDDTDAGWQLDPDPDADHPNVRRLAETAERMVLATHARFAAPPRPSPRDLELYEDLVLVHLFHRLREPLYDVIASALSGRAGQPSLAFYPAFRKHADPLLNPPGCVLPSGLQPHHVFAFCFQIARTFYHVFQYIVGGSPAAIRLRARVWESVFTHDMRRYVRTLYRCMSDVTTLVTGPSGTGKELVARAVGHSGYIAFDEDSRSFTESFVDLFHPINLSAFAPQLIEAELFGHRKGAFTGALEDRRGWLELGRPEGTAFLDEIGDVDHAIQVKLLRVLETRAFQRVGDTATRRFEGRVLCATNRDLGQAMRTGDFREDFYYRICSDRIVTPSLAEQVDGSLDELTDLVLFIARGIVGDEAAVLAEQTVAWVRDHLGSDYAWPGNFRELEQCVRNVLVSGSYHPDRLPPVGSPLDALSAGVREARLTAGDLLRRYCTLVYAREGSYEAAARKLGLDRRTVKARIDPSLLDAPLPGAEPPG